VRNSVSRAILECLHIPEGRHPMKAIAQNSESIVGSTGVCDWENIEVLRREQMERALVRETLPAVSSQHPSSPRSSPAHRNNWSILPCGSGSKLTWGGLVGVELVVSTERLNQVIQHGKIDHGSSWNQVC